MSRTQNTSIAKRRFGCRLPFETQGMDDGYAASGPVKEYKLSQEELAKYGPVKKVNKNWRKLDRETLVRELKKHTVGLVAQKYYTTQDVVFRLVAKYGLELDEKNRLKEDEGMGFQEYDPKPKQKGDGKKKLTVFEALEKMEDLGAELRCLRDILDPDTKATPGVREVLSGYYSECEEKHEAIKKALESTKIEV